MECVCLKQLLVREEVQRAREHDPCVIAGLHGRHQQHITACTLRVLLHPLRRAVRVSAGTATQHCTAHCESQSICIAFALHGVASKRIYLQHTSQPQPHPIRIELPPTYTTHHLISGQVQRCHPPLYSRGLLVAACPTPRNRTGALMPAAPSTGTDFSTFEAAITV